MTESKPGLSGIHKIGCGADIRFHYHIIILTHQGVEFISAAVRPRTQHHWICVDLFMFQHGGQQQIDL